MKGLIQKDLYQMLKNCKMFFLIDIVFIGVSFFSDDKSIFIAFPVLIAAIIPITMLSFDERSGWMDYSGTLPYSEKQIVSEKFLFGLIIQLVISAVVLTVLFIHGSINGSVDIMNDLETIGGLFAMSLLFPSVCLPFCFKFGTEKGRFVYYLVIVAAVAALTQINPVTWEFSPIKGKEWILYVLTVILYAVSWMISVRLLKSKKA